MTGEFGILGAAAAGMEADRAALDVAARNVAAAQVAGPHDRFSRLVPVFARAPESGEGAATVDEVGGERAARDLERRIATLGSPDERSDDDPLETNDAPVRFTGTRVERGTDVDVVTEMVGVLDAQRAFDANASLFDAGKRLAERTIDMGRL